MTERELGLLADEVLARCVQRGECLVWTGAVCGRGYGVIRRRPGNNRLVHRVVYEAAHGELGAGVQVHHRCGERLCCNVEHLEALTAAEHAAAHAAARTTCRAGHPWDEANTTVLARGERRCKACHRARERRRRARADKGRSTA